MTALRRPDQRLAFHQLLDRWARADPAGAHFMIFDESGIVRHRSHSAEPLPIDNADRPYFAVHRERADAGLFIGEPVTARSGPVEGEPVIAFSRRVPAADGSLGGVVVAGMPAKALMEFYESLNVGRSGVVSLFRRDGALLARSPADGRIGQRFDQIQLFRKELPKAEYGSFRSRFVTDGIDRITSYRAVPQYPLIVAVSLSEDEVMAAWHENAMINAAALLTLTAAIGLLVVWLSTALKSRRRNGSGPGHERSQGALHSRDRSRRCDCDRRPRDGPVIQCGSRADVRLRRRHRDRTGSGKPARTRPDRRCRRLAALGRCSTRQRQTARNHGQTR